MYSCLRPMVNEWTHGLRALLKQLGVEEGLSSAIFEKFGPFFKQS